MNSDEVSSKSLNLTTQEEDKLLKHDILLTSTNLPSIEKKESTKIKAHSCCHLDQKLTTMKIKERLFY